MRDKPSEHRGGEPVNQGRRRFCQLTIGGMAVASAATVSYPVISFLKLPKSLQQEEPVEVPLADLAEDAATWVEHLGQQIAIIRVDGGAMAFNGACPHLGCIVQWDGPARAFKCPCHGAVFNDKGEPVAGPVNAPLRKVQVEIKDGVLRIM